MAQLVNFSLNCAKEPNALAICWGELALGLSARAGCHAVPVERVVPDLGGVVEDWPGGLLDDLFERKLLKLGAGDQLVEISHG